MRSLYLSLLAVASAVLPGQTILNVPAGYPTIQAAINAASPGNEIHVAAGTYTGSGNTDLDPLGKPVRILGLGGTAGTIIDCQGTPASPHRAFLIAAGGTGMVIEGFTIRNGWAGDGGGVRVSGAAPTLRGLRFENCTAQGGGALDIESIGSPSGVSVVVENCTFQQNNSSDVGGATSVRGGMHEVVFINCTWNGNTVVGGLGFGGAVSLSIGARASVSQCVISGNTAQRGGGVIMNSGATATFSQCQFSGNTAPQGGGGISIGGGGTSSALMSCTIDANNSGEGGGLLISEAVVTLNGCTLTNNSGGTGLGGGAYVLVNASVVITGGVISGNTALVGGGAAATFGASLTVDDVTVTTNQAASDGGGLYAAIGSRLSVAASRIIANQSSTGVGGGICVISPANPGPTLSLIRTHIEGNTALSNQGGGLAIMDGAAATVSGALIVRNSAGDAAGILVYNMQSSLDIVNCTIADNPTPWGDRELRIFDGVVVVRNCIVRGPPPLFLEAVGTSSLTIGSSNVEGGFSGVGNSSADPAFLNRQSGNYHLTPASPCRDAGQNSAVPSSLLLDLDGVPRVLCGQVDLGAYEFTALAGTGEDLVLETVVNGIAQRCPSRSVSGGQILSLRMTSPNATFVGGIPILAGNVFPNGLPPQPPFAAPFLLLDVSSLIVLLDGTAPPPFFGIVLGYGGVSPSYYVPAGLSAVQLRIQGAVLSALASNGVYALSDAVDISFN